MLMQLSDQLRLSERQVYTWFKNARRRRKGGTNPELSKCKYAFSKCICACKISGIIVKCSFARCTIHALLLEYKEVTKIAASFPCLA